MPIFIAKSADASAHNVGQVEVPIIWDTDALAYRSSIGVVGDGLNYSKQKALNHFFKGLKTGGIWDKISHLFLPIFGRNEGGVNLKNPNYNINFPSDPAIATYDEKGVFFLVGWPTPFTIQRMVMHGGFYNTTSNSANTAFRVGLGLNNIGSLFLAARRGSTGNTGLYLNNNYSAQRPGHLSTRGPVISIFNGNLKYVACLIDSEWAEQTRTESAPNLPDGAITLGGGANSNATTTLASSIGLFTFGSPLSQSEAAVYGALQESLLTVLMQ